MVKIHHRVKALPFGLQKLTCNYLVLFINYDRESVVVKQNKGKQQKVFLIKLFVHFTVNIAGNEPCLDLI